MGSPSFFPQDIDYGDLKSFRKSMGIKESERGKYIDYKGYLR